MKSTVSVLYILLDIRRNVVENPVLEQVTLGHVEVSACS